MPIQIQTLTDDVKTLKAAIEKIAREACALQNPSGQEDALFVNTVPTAANTKEGAAVLYYDGANYRVYYKVNGVMKYAALT